MTVPGIIKKVIIIIVSLCISWLLIEVLLRILAQYSYRIRFYVTNPKKQIFTDTMVDWKSITENTPCPTAPGLQYNGFIYNSHGFETPDVPYEKPAKTKRVLLLGDSFALGVVPYYQHFFRLMESKVNQELVPQTGKKYEFINLGLGCIGPAVERRILEVEGAKYAPDVIILSFFVGNDFTDDNPPYLKYTGLLNKYVPAIHIPARLGDSSLVSLVENLYLVYTTGKGLQPVAKTDHTGITGVYVGGSWVDRYDPMRPTMTDNAYREKISRDLGIYFTDGYPSFPRVEGDIRRMAQISRSLHANFLVLIIPAEIQLNKKLLDSVTWVARRNQEKPDVYLPQQQLTNFLKKESIDFIDLLPEFEKNASNPAIYYQPNDEHLNTYGNQAAADLLYPWLYNHLNK